MKHMEILEAVRKVFAETVVSEILLLREQQHIIEQHLNECSRKLDDIHCRLEAAQTEIAEHICGGVVTSCQG